MYSKAIELYPSSAIYYANRALAHLRQENFGLALQDGVSAVKTDPSYLKGYYRRAAAHMSLGKFKQALSDFEYVSGFLLGNIYMFYLKVLFLGGQVQAQWQGRKDEIHRVQ